MVTEIDETMRLILSPPRTADTCTRLPVSTVPSLSLKHPAVGNVEFVPVVYTPPEWPEYTAPFAPSTNATQIWLADSAPSDRCAVTYCTSCAQFRFPQLAVVSHCPTGTVAP